MKRKNHFLYLLSLPALLACEELEIPPSNNFVVEAYITADETVQDITIKETAPLIADSIITVPIDRAQVSLSRAGGTPLLLDYNPATGRYQAPEGMDLPISSAEAYDLAVTLDGITATASTTVPEKPEALSLSDTIIRIPTLTLNFGLREQIEELFNEARITLNWEGEPGRSYFVVIGQRASTPASILPEGIPQQSLDLLSSFRFISEPSEASSFVIIGVALETYGPHIAKVYSVNQEYADLFNSAAQDSRDLNEPPSNISNGLGIFTAFAVDSIAFEVIRE